ncbi:hypothetical protein HNP03_002504 [Pseudomonas rhodesiae]|uniref:hypothetical protein n=1 Tax=Pseudomonas rhodesiae TaxID=76760 RepID=UPI00161D4AC3|nr:hypothetical protein [Pseudomonas rhodesiae]MBB4813877.1 hypothetical protein [Pseudomonas rhodesiae]
MKWILRLINAKGETFFSEPADLNGNRRLCRNSLFAELFDSFQAAERGLSDFQLLWEFRGYVLDILEAGASDGFVLTDMANQRSTEIAVSC